MSSAPDARAFRHALGAFATGITVVTTVDAAGEPVGFTANSFNSVSLDPPLVLFSLARSASSWDAFGAAQVFAVNVLGAEHQELSQRFARTGGPKFEGTAFAARATGAPVLADALAFFDCRVRSRHDGGDHVIFVGEVAAFGRREGEPLLYFAGQYRALR